MTPATPDVTIVEVGPRDGLQNEKQAIPAVQKIALIDLLSAAGFQRIEAASFVSPRWVPQMADGADVMAGIQRRPGTSYAALTPNMKGYEAARAAGVDEVAIFGAASETFSRKNINCSIAESIERFRPVAEAARADGIAVRGYISCAVACPYEGPIDPAEVAHVTELLFDLGRFNRPLIGARDGTRDVTAHSYAIGSRGYISCAVACPYEGPIEPAEVAHVTELLFDLGCYEVSLGDTIGKGTPGTVATMLDAVVAVAPAAKLAGHYHDTNGRALESVAVSLDRGLRVFDSAVGGLGGCPYAPGAKGNLSTGKLARHLAGQGIETGIDLDALARAEAFVQGLQETLGRSS